MEVDVRRHLQPGDDVSCVLDQLVEVGHLASFGKLVSQVNLQIVELVGDGHVWSDG